MWLNTFVGIGFVGWTTLRCLPSGMADTRDDISITSVSKIGQERKIGRPMPVP